MPFDQEKIDKIANQSRGIFDNYIYKTDDTCADVEAAGYFAECRFAINDPDSWNNAIIEVQASDCFVKGTIVNGDFVVLLPSGGDIVCAALTLSTLGAFPPTTVDNIFIGNTFTSTRNIGFGNSPPAGTDIVNLFNFDGGGPLAFEADAAQPSVLNDGGQFGGGCYATDLSGGVGVILQFGTGSDGKVVDAFTFADITTGLSYPAAWPVTLHIEPQEDGNAYYRFEDGNGTLIATGTHFSIGGMAGKAVQLFEVVEAPATDGSNLSTTFVPDVVDFKMPLNNPSAQSWCSFPAGAPPVPEQKFFEGAGIPPTPPVSLINSDRTIDVLADGVNDIEFQYVAGWNLGAVPASVADPDGNVFEFEFDKNTLDSLSLAWQLSGNDAQNIATNFFLQWFTEKRLTVMGNTLLNTELDPLDVIAVQILSNGAFDSLMRIFWTPNGGTPLVLDTFHINSDEDFNVLFSSAGGPIPAAAQEFEMTFNAIESQMSGTYPDGAKDYEGTALVTTSGPFVEPPATWHPVGFKNEDPQYNDTVVVSGGNKTVTFTHAGTNPSVFDGGVFSPKFAQQQGTGGVIAFTVKVATADASEQSAKITLAGVGGTQNNQKGELRRNAAGDIIYEINTVETTLVAATPISTGDYLTGVVNWLTNQMRFYFWDASAATLHDSGWQSFFINGENKSGMILYAEANRLASGESLVLENQYIDADMDQAQTITELVNILAEDCKGTVIS